jgi:hypothetical protein
VFFREEKRKTTEGTEEEGKTTKGTKGTKGGEKLGGKR